MSVKDYTSVRFDQMLIDLDPDCVEIIDDIEFEFSVETSEDDDE